MQRPKKQSRKFNGIRPLALSAISATESGRPRAALPFLRRIVVLTGKIDRELARMERVFAPPLVEPALVGRVRKVTADEKLENAARLLSTMPTVVELGKRACMLAIEMHERLERAGVDASDLYRRVAQLTESGKALRAELEGLEAAVDGRVS